MTALAAGLGGVLIVLLGLRAAPLALGPPARPPTAPPVSTATGRPTRAGRSTASTDDETAMAAWCEQAARALRAGASLARAVADASAAQPEPGKVFAPALHALGRGRALASALDTVAVEPGDPAALVVVVLRAAAELGGPAAAPLERAALTLHARAAERAERRSASAQARLSARILTALPVSTLGLLVVAEPASRSAVASPAGTVCLAAGAAFNGAGWWWMRTLIRTAA